MQQQGLVLTVSERLSHRFRHRRNHRNRAAGTHIKGHQRAQRQSIFHLPRCECRGDAAPQRQQDCTMRRHPPTDSD